MEKKRVMIVDDEEDFLELIKANLEMTGNYEVMTLSDAAGLISSVRSFKPHIILLDIIMPHVDGVEACKILNSDPNTARIPIIIMSALYSDKDKLMMYKLGVVDFMPKPIEKDDLVVKIEKALRFK